MTQTDKTETTPPSPAQEARPAAPQLTPLPLPPGLVTVPEAARLLGLTIHTVHSQIQRGKLPAFVLGEGRRATYFIAHTELEAYRTAYRGTRRPSKQRDPGTTQGNV